MKLVGKSINSYLFISPNKSILERLNIASRNPLLQSTHSIEFVPRDSEHFICEYKTDLLVKTCTQIDHRLEKWSRKVTLPYHKQIANFSLQRSNL